MGTSIARRTTVLWLAGALSVVPILATPAADAARHRCSRPSGGAVVMTARSVVIYKTTRAVPSEGETLRTWYACFRSTGKRSVIYRGGLTREEGGRSAREFRVRGRFVAFVTEEARDTLHSFDIRISDVRRGRTHVVPGVANDIPFTLHRLLVSSRGVAVWNFTAPYSPTPGVGRDVVGVRDASGDRILDAATAGAITDVRFSGSRVTWMNNGVPRSASVTAPD